MKSLKAICNVNIPNSLHSLLESSILNIEDNIESGDIDTLFSLLISGNEDNFRIARNIIYNDVISTQKQLRRKNDFKENNLYINPVCGVACMLPGAEPKRSRDLYRYSYVPAFGGGWSSLACRGRL